MLSYQVRIEEPGPLYIRLKYDTRCCCVRVSGWEITPCGGPGPVEVTNTVRLGDAIVNVNEACLLDKEFQTIVLLIKRSSCPRLLTFRRDKADRPHSKRVNTSGYDLCARKDTYCDHTKPSTRLLPPFEQLFTEEIDEARLRSFASAGLPDAGSTRAIVWRLLLHYLPLRHNSWHDCLDSQRVLYTQFLCEFDTASSHRPNYSSMPCSGALGCNQPSNEGMNCDDVLVSFSGLANTWSQSSAGKSLDAWSEQQADCKLKQDIQKDVTRVHPELVSFFESSGASRYDAMSRILFIYAKLNPGVRYVQGMNELLGTIFYVFASDPCKPWADYAEPDTFFCFSNLMATMRDVYIHTLDYTDVGLHGKLTVLNDLLRRCDYELWCHLRNHQLDPCHYSLRWMTTLLAREFAMRHTLRLWDAIFSETAPVDFLSYFCLAMLVAQRSSLLQGDFCRCLHLLQNYPTSDPDTLLSQAHALRGVLINDDKKKVDVVSSFAIQFKSVW